MSVIFRNISAEGAAFGEVEINQQNPWASLHQARQNKLIVQGMIGGMEKFEIDGQEQWALLVFFETPDETIKGIIPRVASGFRNRMQMEAAVGRQLVFMVKAVDKANGICALDRVAALEKMMDITLKTVKEGDTRIGVVERVNRFRAVLNIGGIPSVIRRRDFSYNYTDDLRDVLYVGDSLEVKVSRIREKMIQERVRKAVEVKPDVEELETEEVEELTPEEEIVETLATEIEREELVREDEKTEIPVKVSVKPTVNYEVVERKLTIFDISHKVILKNPWLKVQERYKVTGQYAGIVTGIADTGAFVQLGYGIDGMSPHPEEGVLPVGTKVLFRVYEIKPEKERIGGRVTRVL